jgi:hypothetical protein
MPFLSVKNGANSRGFYTPRTGEMVNHERTKDGCG